MSMNAPTVALLVSAVMWGVTWWPLKTLHQMGFDGLVLTTAAFGTASIVMLPVLWMQRGSLGRGLPALLLIMVLGGYANLSFTLAMMYGEVVRAMALFYMVPMWGVLGGRLFLGERIDCGRAAAVVFALGGAFMVLGGPQILSGQVSWLDLLAISAGLAFALNNIVFRYAQATPVSSKLTAMLLGCFMLSALLVFQFELQSWPSVSHRDWFWVGVYGIAWLLLATALTQWAVTHMQAGRASVIIILELLTAVATATWIGGEHMSVAEMGGAALILFGALIEARREGDADIAVPVHAGDFRHV